MNDNSSIFAYVTDSGSAVVHAVDVYLDPTSRHLEIELPKAAFSEEYVEAEGRRIRYVAVSHVRQSLDSEPECGYVTILGGLKSLTASVPGYHTFCLTYPVE